MSHEIQQNDNVLLYQKRAWHGLGTIIEDQLTCTQALDRCGLDWNVTPWSLVAEGPDGQRIEVDSHVLNVRADDESPLGVVSRSYTAVQNKALAEFADSLAKGNDSVKIETCGSIMGGKKIWFLLRGESFSIRGKDNMDPYILVSNGHDGGTALRMTPTTIRTVCSNTLHAVIPYGTDEGKKIRKASYVTRHTSGIADRLEEARKALHLYEFAIKETREVAEMLAKSEVNREKLGNYFVEVYSEMKGYEIPSNPKDAKEARRRDVATSAWHSFSKRFDDEISVSGASAWTAFNAFSGLVQHDMKARGSSDEDRVEKRVDSNLFGLNADRTYNALQSAMALVS